MLRKPYEQGAGSGLCAAYAIINALSLLFPRLLTSDVEEKLLPVLADASGDAGTLLKEGAERPQVSRMLAGVYAWTQEQGWPFWEVRELHPIPGEPSADFWDALAVELEVPRTAAVLGLGKDTERSSYEEHYTCVVRVTKSFIFLRDSAKYGSRLPRKDFGIRPEPRWSLEDCWVLTRPTH